MFRIFTVKKYYLGKSVEELEKLQKGIEAKLKDRSEGETNQDVCYN